MSCVSRDELQGGHGDLEPVPPLGGGLHPAVWWQNVHRGPTRPVSLTQKQIMSDPVSCSAAGPQRSPPCAQEAPALRAVHLHPSAGPVR